MKATELELFVAELHLVFYWLTNLMTNPVAFVLLLPMWLVTGAFILMLEPKSL